MRLGVVQMDAGSEMGFDDEIREIKDSNERCREARRE